MALTNARLLKHDFPVHGTPPFGGVSQRYVEGEGHGGGSQVNAALSTIGCCRGRSSKTVANRGWEGH